MEFTLLLEYFVLAFLSSFAVLQMVAVEKNKEKLKLLRSHSLTIFVSLLVIFLSFFWFFASRDRNVQTYMEGAQISTTFGLGAFLSIVVTKILKSFYGHN
jgi:hypothetical protein